jgi:hypothetical protein
MSGGSSAKLAKWICVIVSGRFTARIYNGVHKVEKKGTEAPLAGRPWPGTPIPVEIITPFSIWCDGDFAGFLRLSAMQLQS